MTEQEFYHDYMQDIYARAGSKEDFSEEQFVEEMCDFLVEQAIIDTYDSAFFKKTHQGIRIDAWNFNKATQELSFFICEYSPTPELRTISQSDVETHFKRAERFFINAKTNTFYQELEESLPIYKVARDIAENIKDISKIQFFLLSNASLSTRFKNLDRGSVNGYKTVYDIWDISRRARIAQSGKEKEDITIDFTEFVPGGIQCLPASTESSKCKSYLLAIPGIMLSDIYDKYGERLLEQNVRTFLQFRGGVNKGIRNTLKNQPEMFFAYNNGLTVTAEYIDEKNNKIYSTRNLQIVNGGQTTASIFMAKLQNKKDIDLEKVYVQVKLSIINPENVDEIVPEISRCANTQNKVSSADFFSNHAFHKRIEDFSRRSLAPSPDGTLTETYWFYERARGQFANKQAKMTQTQKKQFLIQNPKYQMFTKTDLAKYENTFTQLPHYVSKGAQWNFGKFAEEISGKDDSNKGLWENNDLQFNELYFRQLIAKAILFKSLDKRIMKQDWYSGYKANIVTYTLAKFVNIVASLGKFIDFMQIWKNQCISAQLEADLLLLAEQINNVITDTEENVTQFCKKEFCWQKVKEIRFFLSDYVLNELIEIEESTNRKKDAKKDQKILNKINAQIEVFNKGLNYWTALIGWAKNTNVFSDKEMSILSSTLRMNTTPPSEKQSNVILKIEVIAKEEGFYFNG